ncbi:hypothetical protein L917_09043 [Plasmopara halstedii]|uniref:Transferase n=1 Tax=Plasmopara halstedii TaxID=4781 RepID=A0A0P1AQ58_PLAHL|nr:hypothetical protein L917_09043 [Plasmopara halstedii]CEG43376.1 hypothetical protein L917_09043 [Plasmopara halstedii]|eukprot:XP_024579745.1 hypothetical protein L917_09043 [Plasmopara halstedii]
MASSFDELLHPLSPMDAVMHSFGFVILYIFPPSTSVSFDLNKLHSSFIALVEQDYPILIGELYVDPSSGIVNVKQSAECRQKGAAGIRFETNPRNSMTTEQAIEERSLDLMPGTRGKKELICAKGTLLKDGGLAIGINASHTLFDGEAMFTFMTVWGQLYNGVKKEERIVVSHARHLLNGSGKEAKMNHPEFRVVQTNGATENAQLPTKVPPATSHHLFHFTSKMMKRIKDVATSSRLDGQVAAETPYVSTVDAITALFTILISRARDHRQDVNITTGVNARRRLNPPLPQNYVGNAIFNAFSTYKNVELQPQAEDEDFVSPAMLNKVARCVRDSILQRNNAYLRDAIDFLTLQNNVAAVQVGTNFVFGPDLMFTSWLHLGMYKADFDGVHPWFACAPRLPCYDGFVMITEAQKGGDGIDVAVFLESNAMQKLDKMFAEVSYLYNDKV